ncbi:uncharacterized protein C8A04DRAFT_33199 [Dichotomopilus funicola]|uniref:Uncharacterized protein n=1 Tax=Dichotomopilus funicola TaxID=1934379 RepID=A0AAN6UUM0_9PEZI|nr:hypothetical protein C8A04DRAFT_33199 [Dichotomopilus funicola]
MSTKSPPSIGSTEVQAPRSSTGTTTRVPEKSHINCGSTKSHPLLVSNNATSMLTRWLYDVDDVTVTEKLQRDALDQGENSTDGK